MSMRKILERDKKKMKHKLPEPYSNEDVVYRDVVALLGQDIVQKIKQEGSDWSSPFKVQDEVELTVSALSSNGEQPVSYHNFQPLISP